MSIKVEHVSFTYSKKTPNSYEALHDVSLEIKNNSITGIVGHTGSGKSTLVQIFNGLLKPESGRVVVDDFVIDSKSRKIKNIKQLRKHVGLVFQFPEYQLFDETVEKDVSFGPKNFGLDAESALKKAHEALSMVGIDESYYKRSPFELSGGEKRKVALAGILAIDPDILVLDEPTAGLDPKSSLEVLNLVGKLHEAGKTIVIITHDMDLLFRYCDHVVLLKDGKVAYDGEPNNLFSENIDDLSIDVPKIYQFLDILRKHGVSIPKDTSIKSVEDIVKLLTERRKK